MRFGSSGSLNNQNCAVQIGGRTYDELGAERQFIQGPNAVTPHYDAG